MHNRKDYCLFAICWLLLTVNGLAQTEGFIGPGRYRIDSLASGKSLDVKAEDRRTVQQWSSTSAPNQQWDIEDAGGGYFYLRSVETNKMLDFAENRVRDGLPLIVAERRDSDNQKWKISDSGNGQFTIVSKSGKAVDIPANLRANDGAALQTQGLHGLENQRFRFIRLGDLPVATGSTRGRNMPERSAPAPVDPNLRYGGPGRYRLQFVHSGKSLDLFSGDYEKVQQWTTHNEANQQWDIEDAGGGLVYIRSAANGKALEVMARRPIDGTPVKATDMRNAEEQKWRIVEAGNGEYSIVSRFGRVIDLHAFSKDDGQAIQMWKENRAENQRLRFARVVPQYQSIAGRGARGRGETPVTPPAPVEEEYVSGSLVWRGRVDREILLDLRGGQFSERTVTGRSFNNGRVLKSSGRMPLRSLSVRIRNIKKVKGTVEIAEQPTVANNYTAVIRIRNDEKDSADYEFEVSW